MMEENLNRSKISNIVEDIDRRFKNLMKSKEKRYSMFTQSTKFKAPPVTIKKGVKKSSSKKVIGVEEDENKQQINTVKPSEKKIKIKGN